MLKALVTGVNGFVGRHLATHLVACGCTVYGIVRSPGWAAGLPDVLIVPCDLRDASRLQAVLAEIAPELVFHLAAQASVGTSWRDPEATIANNVLCQLHLLEGLVKSGQRPRVLVVGSNEEYGLIDPWEIPVRETNPLRPNSPYALSKVAQDFMGYQYYVSHGLPCVRVRPFNHAGPGQRDDFVVSAFARQVAEIEAGLREPVLRVGNLDAQRDFTDVRDIVRAYYLVLTKGEPGDVYNLGSGRPISVSYVLESLVGLSDAEVRVERDPERMRPSDTPLSVCDAGKAHAVTGWRPEIPFEKTLRDVLDDWRQRVRRGGQA